MAQKLPEEHPVPVAILLNHLLSNTVVPFYDCYELFQLVNGLVASNAPRSELMSICESLSRLGCSKVQELVQLINSSHENLAPQSVR